MFWGFGISVFVFVLGCWICFWFNFGCVFWVVFRICRVGCFALNLVFWVCDFSLWVLVLLLDVLFWWLIDDFWLFGLKWIGVCLFVMFVGWRVCSFWGFVEFVDAFDWFAFEFWFSRICSLDIACECLCGLFDCEFGNWLKLLVYDCLYMFRTIVCILFFVCLIDLFWVLFALVYVFRFGVLSCWFGFGLIGECLYLLVEAVIVS